jgi:hypothetical protein
MLAAELAVLRRDLRATIRAYAARLEIDLAESVATVSSKGAEALSREQLYDIRDFTIMVRKRKLKPEKGRRKDLRKIDSLIRDFALNHSSQLIFGPFRIKLGFSRPIGECAAICGYVFEGAR